jgi:prepilin-type N-terminal cleavage/methylation domain-containing protein
MNCRTPSSKSSIRGLSLVELLVAVAIGSMILAAAVVLWVFVLTSFTAAGNYRDLDAKSRLAVDAMLQEMRQDSAVTGFQTTVTNAWLSLTNAQAGTAVTYTWDSTSRALVSQKTGQPNRTYLTECDLWSFQLFQRAPHTNGSYIFIPATNSSGVLDTTIVKLINMNWRCSRTIVGKKMNTENVQTAQVVLRNKQ